MKPKEDPILIITTADQDCLDCDDECFKVPDCRARFLYDPSRGQCPLLRFRQN